MNKSNSSQMKNSEKNLEHFFIHIFTYTLYLYSHRYIDTQIDR